MHGGRTFEVGTPNPSKPFGAMTWLLFALGSYLRFKDIELITDLAYGSLAGMLFMRI